MATINDIVLIYYEDQPFSYARVEEILPDSKKNWYHIKLLLLQVPLETVTWILKDTYINGDEFTMGGKRMRLEKVIPPDEDDDEDDFVDENLLKTIEPDTSETDTSETKKTDSKVVSFKKRKPKK
ncbi:MAG: hypothetical protein PF482_13595 [Desulfobacteraceae bacterium]|jgi:hypothetical protein|nr:hypothetical protein [Desulfobacteraceae bacterium]